MNSEEIIKDFVNEVHELALQLMVKDNKVEGKHYAAMKIILKKRNINIQLP